MPHCLFRQQLCSRRTLVRRDEPGRHEAEKFGNQFYDGKQE
jgi:hypothetical protein